MNKKGFVMLLAIIFVLVFAMPAMGANVIVNNNQLDVSTKIENGRTLVPLRAIFEALNSEITWYGSTQSIVATKDNTKITLSIGQTIATKNGNNVTLEVPPKIGNEKTMVPLRFVSEALGASVKWDGATQTITITSGSGL